MAGLRRSSLVAVGLLGSIAAADAARGEGALTPGQEATQQLYYLVLIPALGIGILVMVLVGYAILKFRVRPGHTEGPAFAKTHDPKLETLWTVIPALILLIVGVASVQTLIVTDTIPPNPDVTVCVYAQQWAWSFHAITNGTCPAELPEEAMGGAFSVKVGQVVRLDFASVDVAHSFSIPAYWLKVDVIPGRQNVYWFKALQAGEFIVECAEFCGLRHYSMVARLHVLAA